MIRFGIKRRIKKKIKYWQSLLGRRRSRATFICITGSSAKSTTTGIISHILSGVAPVQDQVIWNNLGNYIEMLRDISPMQRYAVCEIASAGPGTLQPTIDLLRPSVGVVTLVALDHYSAFRTLETVAEEKGKLIEALPEDGLAVLNHDDPHVLAMASRTQARVVTFGTQGGDYRVTRIGASVPGRLIVTITHNGGTFEMETRLTGAHNSLAVAAAFACCHQLGAPTSLIKEKLGSFEPIFGRCSAHFIDNGPVFIADVKAPYHSIYLPIEMMKAFSAPRKRIVIGNISDYSGNPNRKYRDIYRASQEAADQVIFVGDKAHRSKATAEEIAEQRFVEKRSVEEAAAFVKETAMPGEIILLKSAQNLHLERILLNFDEEVRCWEAACGKPVRCIIDCGLYTVPFDQHKKKTKKKRWWRSTGR